MKNTLWKKKNSKITDIVMTVAMPALNADKIIWLALESLKNQTNINFQGELIIMEEYGISNSIIKQYYGKLPNCIRIIHRYIDPKKDGIHGNYKPIIRNNKKIQVTGTYPLIWKWLNIGILAAPNSKIFVLHATDCYSPPKRLYIHYQHFLNKECIFSSQPKGLFYNIKNKKTLLYHDDSLLNFRKTHLNMALRTEHLNKYVTKKTKLFNKGIDGHIIRCILDNLNYKYLTEKSHLFDNSIDPNNWKYSLDTDGFNNISLKRSSIYDSIDYPNKIKKYIGNHYVVWKSYNNINHNMNNYIPKYIIDKLYVLYYHKNNINVLLNDMQSNMINITKQIDKSKPPEIKLLESFSTNSDTAYLYIIILLVLIIGMLKLNKIF